MLRIKGLEVQVPGFQLGPIDLEVPEGEFFALIGPTGSGKSLFLETIMGLLPRNVLAHRGEISWKGREISALPPHRRGIGILYQDSALFPHMTVEENIRYGLRYHKIQRDEAERRFRFLVERFEIDRILHRSPVRISGGERQRVALARVLILNPQIVMLDEPLSAIDPLFRQEIRSLLRQLHAELGLTFIMVSHNFDEVLYLAGKGAIIKKGRVIQTGDIKDIFNRPSSVFVAKFVGAKNIFEARCCGNSLLKAGGLEIRAASSCKRKATYISLRPEKLMPLSAYGSETRPENCFRGKIQEISKTNFHLNLTIRAGGLAFYAIWPEQMVAHLGLEVGSEVEFGFRAKDVNLFSG